MEDRKSRYRRKCIPWFKTFGFNLERMIPEVPTYTRPGTRWDTDLRKVREWHENEVYRNHTVRCSGAEVDWKLHWYDCQGTLESEWRETVEEWYLSFGKEDGNTFVSDFLVSVTGCPLWELVAPTFSRLLTKTEIHLWRTSIRHPMSPTGSSYLRSFIPEMLRRITAEKGDGTEGQGSERERGTLTEVI